MLFMLVCSLLACVQGLGVVWYKGFLMMFLSISKLLKSTVGSVFVDFCRFINSVMLVVRKRP